MRHGVVYAVRNRAELGIAVLEHYVSVLRVEAAHYSLDLELLAALELYFFKRFAARSVIVFVSYRKRFARYQVLYVLRQVERRSALALVPKLRCVYHKRRYVPFVACYAVTAFRYYFACRVLCRKRVSDRRFARSVIPLVIDVGQRKRCDVAAFPYVPYSFKLAFYRDYVLVLRPASAEIIQYAYVSARKYHVRKRGHGYRLLVDFKRLFRARQPVFVSPVAF